MVCNQIPLIFKSFQPFMSLDVTISVRVTSLCEPSDFIKLNFANDTCLWPDKNHPWQRWRRGSCKISSSNVQNSNLMKQFYWAAKNASSGFLHPTCMWNRKVTSKPSCHSQQRCAQCSGGFAEPWAGAAPLGLSVCAWGALGGDTPLPAVLLWVSAVILGWHGVSDWPYCSAATRLARSACKWGIIPVWCW